MKKVNELIAEVETSVGSLFTKDDVIKLLEQVESEMQCSWSLYSQLETILQLIKRIEVDLDSAVFEISGGNTIELTSVDLSYHIDVVKHDLSKVVDELKAAGHCIVI